MLNPEAGGEARRFPELPEGIPPWAFLGFPAPSLSPSLLLGKADLLETCRAWGWLPSPLQC